MPTDASFGNLLRKLIKDAGLSQYGFYSAANITKPYFYDILSGKINPPPFAQQQKFADVLKLDEETRRTFFDTAARERKEMPGDITEYVNSHPECLKQIRNTIKLTSGQ